jgi:CHAD domain-containing protein
MAEKWVAGLEPGMPLSEAARLVLGARLGIVRAYLPLAVHHPDADLENVHQLRVGTRRADAALRIFRVCIPGKVYRKARRELREVRRAAGAARDWDVFLLGLDERLAKGAASEVAGLDFLVAYAMGQRRAAQAALTELPDEPPCAALPDGVSAEESEPTLSEAARPAMEGLLELFTEATSGDLDDYAQLHGVRILGKRLRYAMEVFAPCFERSFREEVYPRVEEMQEILGRANDSHVAVGRLAELRARAKAHPPTWARAKAGVESLLRFHQRRLPQERRRFVTWLASWDGAAVLA